MEMTSTIKKRCARTDDPLTVYSDSDSANIVAYDFNWQYPAITEQHAFERAKALLPYSKSCIYVAVPWATFIDELNTKKSTEDGFLPILHRIKQHTKEYAVVATVCQHVFAFKYLWLFEQCGITHLFWSHASKDLLEQRAKELIPFETQPFPLFPAQYPCGFLNRANMNSRYLYSFIGAEPSLCYLTDSRNHIFEELWHDPGAKLIRRKEWHFQRVVYDAQIGDKKLTEAETAAIKNDTVEYCEILEQSTFSLCPSGSGPNSIRLWESLMVGAIPVIISDKLLLPGNQKLWEESCIFISENREHVTQIPKILRDIFLDTDRLLRCKSAVTQLAYLYGPGYFIHDIAILFLTHAASQVQRKLAAIKPETEPKLKSDERLPLRLQEMIVALRRANSDEERISLIRMLSLSLGLVLKQGLMSKTQANEILESLKSLLTAEEANILLTHSPITKSYNLGNSK